MRLKQVWRVAAGAMVFAGLGAVWNCTTGRPSGTEVVETEFTGNVNFGTPLVAANIELFEIVDGDRGVSLGTAITDDNGEFSVSTFFYEGLVEVCAVGGRFEDLRTGLAVSLDEPLCTVVENTDEGLRVHAWNVLVSAALPSGGAEPAALLAAQRDWRGRLACAADGLDVIGVTPEDPRVAGEGSALSAALYSGLLHGALSELASEISIELGFTPGARFTPLSLLRGAITDLRDGAIDGFNGSTQVAVEGYAFTSETFASRLALALRGFLATDLNSGGFDEGDLGDAISCIGGNLDIAAPVVTWLSPAEGAIASGPLPVSAVVVDDSAITALNFDDPNAFSDVNAITVATSTNVSAVFDPEALPNGEYALTLRAVDAEGNEAVATRTVVIDKDAPRITVAQPAANATVSGTVTIQANAEDPQGLIRFDLIAPEGITAAVSNGALIAQWDTTLFTDGPVVLVFEAEDSLGNVGELSVPVVLDNLAPSVINGAVRLETDVVGATIEAFDFNGFERGDLLGSTVSEDDGSFSIEIPDFHSGLLVLDVSGAAATYESLIDRATVRFTLDDRLSTIVEHQPSVAGTVIEPIYINGLTSVGTRFAEANADGGGDPLRGFGLLGEYLRPADPIDVRRTLGSDMTQNVVADTDEAQFVGLWHIGLSRLGGDIATTVSAPISSGRTTNMLERLLQDMESGQFDGTNASGGAVRLLTTAEAFDTNTLRFAIANAIIRFLEAEPIGALPQTNETGLVLANFFGPGGYLFALAENESELFGDAPPPISLDIEPPVVTIQLLDASNQPIGALDPVPVGTVETIRIRAQDASGVPAAPVYSLSPGPQSALGIPGAPMVGATSTILDIPVTVLSLDDGTQTFTAEATDALGDTTTEVLTFVTDKTPPSLTLSAPTNVTASPVTATVNVADASEMTLTYRLNGAAIATRVNFTGTTDSLSVDIPCNQASTLSVIATDAAGNSTERQSTTVCDNTPPTITFEPSTYRQESGVTATLSNAVVQFGSNIDLTSGGVPTIQKVEGFYNNATNAPRLVYSVTDPTSVGTANNALSINYRFQGCATGSSTSVAADPSGSYSLNLTPETLHPCLRTVPSSQTQQVTITATDALGNTASRTLAFRVQLRPIPVVIDQCGIGRDLNDLAYSGLKGTFNGTSGSAWGATVAWPYPATAAHDFPDIVVSVSGGAANYTMNRWDELTDIVEANIKYAVGSNPPPDNSYVRYTCGPGEFIIEGSGGVNPRQNQTFSAPYNLYTGTSLRLNGNPVSGNAISRGAQYSAAIDAFFPALFETSYHGGSDFIGDKYVLRGEGTIREYVDVSSIPGGWKITRNDYICGAVLDRSVVSVSPPTITAKRGASAYPVVRVNSCTTFPSVNRTITP